MDASDAPVDDVTIELLDTPAVTRRTVVNNAAGKFFIALTVPGTYLLRASRRGYAGIETPPIEIGEGEVVEVELRLDVKPVELEPQPTPAGR